MERTSKLVGRPAVRRIACRRCGMEVEVQRDASSVTLHYDLDVWRQSKCFCVGPASRSLFLELERSVSVLPVGPPAAPQQTIPRCRTASSLRRRYSCEGGDMKVPTLYLFEATTREFLAVGSDKTGCTMPRLAIGLGWLLRREIKPYELPADVVLTAYKQGFSMLDGDIFDPGTEFELEEGPKKP